MALTRREFMKSAAAAGLATIAPKSHRPNIVLILVDDLGNRSLSCFGATVPTPNLDRLARKGIVFRNAHAAPMCAPTRDEMMTGLSRARFKGRPGAEVPFFTNRLQRLGYATGIAGKWFVGSVFDPPLRGFGESCILVNGYRHWAPDVMVWGSGGRFKELNQPQVEGRLNEWEIPLDETERYHATRLPDHYGEDVAVDLLCDFMDRHREGPFLAYYASKLTHVPHVPTPDGDPGAIAAFKTAFAASHDRNLQGLGEAAEKQAAQRGIRIDDSNYRNDGLHYLDKLAARLIDKIRGLGIERDTIVIFASDNGNSALDPLPEGAERLPGRKGGCREGGTRIPLIVSWPGRIRPGSACDDLVHVQDFGPTLLELAGGSMPPGDSYDGRSFAPQLLGQEGSPREWFIGTGAHPSIWLKRVVEELGKPRMEAYSLVWVRGRRYKLYNDGRFYDLSEDLMEQRRIPPGNGSPAAEAARREYQVILDQITGASGS